MAATSATPAILVEFRQPEEDSVILENTFSDHTGKHDYFPHLIVTDLSLNPKGVVKYIYAIYNQRIREGIGYAPAQNFPGYEEYAVNGNVIYFPSSQPDIFIGIINRRENFIPDLYQEVREAGQVEILDEATADSIIVRLISFLSTMKIGSYNGQGIMWYPENYQGSIDEAEQRPNEEYEEYTRRRICNHIKSRPLPMARFPSIPEEHIQYLNEMMSSLANHRDITNVVSKSYFATVFRHRSDMNVFALRSLMTDEFRCIKNNEVVDNNSIFIFTDEQLDTYGTTIPTKEARNILRMYVGDYLDQLDLSRSYITGSAMTAAIIQTRRHNELKVDEMIAIHYPVILTSMSTSDLSRFHDGENINLWNPRAISTKEGVLSKGAESISFTIRPGSDVDIAIDNSVTDEEYDQIANRHYEIIRQYHPYVKMQKIMKPRGDWNYVIYTDDPQFLPIFRTVEMYRTTFRNICSHHVGAVRGCYTSRWTESPQFYLTASAIYTSHAHATPNYHYFAGKKSTPQDVIVKNLQRGIDVLDQVLGEIIADYMRTKNIELSYLPFYLGKNVPYSIFAAGIEYSYAIETLRRRQLKRQKEIERNNALHRQKEVDLTRSREYRAIADMRRQGIIVNTIDEVREIAELRQQGINISSIEEARYYREIIRQGYQPPSEEDEPTFASIIG
jgi:hypothetical protein